MPMKPIHTMDAVTIATDVSTGTLSARTVVECDPRPHQGARPELGAFTDVTTARALAKADAVDADRAAGIPPGALAGVPFAVKNLFDLAGVTTRAGSKINRDNPPASARCLSGRAARGGRRSLRRCTQHGRVRLRLHRRKRARRAVAQPARSDADERRFVGRLRHGRRGGPRAAGARLRHQRLDPRAIVALRHLRAEADLRPAEPRPQLPLRSQPRSSGPVRPHRGRSRAQL